MDPDNLALRKQIWALLYPERFYPEIDVEWQKERLRLDLAEEVLMRQGECGPGCRIG